MLIKITHLAQILDYIMQIIGTYIKVMIYTRNQKYIITKKLTTKLIRIIVRTVEMLRTIH